jgi:hypothetical protein
MYSYTIDTTVVPTNSEGSSMNKEMIIELLESGAYFNSAESKLYHASFKKGWRKLRWSDISWKAVDRAHGMFGTQRLRKENSVYRIV